mmetsp:Transcript_17145/g.37955  ORF Transcript_17145/g.37955 Transcript_17145/m.37955 type:complete len:114 (+) Transcript_17145:146-487(+)
MRIAAASVTFAAVAYLLDTNSVEGKDVKKHVESPVDTSTTTEKVRVKERATTSLWDHSKSKVRDGTTNKCSEVIQTAVRSTLSGLGNVVHQMQQEGDYPIERTFSLKLCTYAV